MRLVVFSHCSVVKRFRKRFELLAQLPGVSQVTVITPPCWNEAGALVTSEPEASPGYRVTVEECFFSGNSRQHAHLYRNIWKILKAFKPDLIYLDEEPNSLVSLQVVLAAQMLPNQPRIIFCTYQNVVKSIGDLGLLRSILYRTARRVVYRYSAAAHAVAPGAVRFLRQTGFSKQIFQFPPIGHGQAVCAPPEVGSARRTRPTTIGYLGRLAPEKGVDLLLKACDRLRFPLLIAGAGPEEETLRHFVSDRKLQQHVQFVGRVSHDAVSHFYSQVDILAVPSRPLFKWAEQYGRVLVEAMAHGVVPVGSTCGEIPYVIGDGGLVFECNDADALEDRLKCLLESPNLLDAFQAKATRRAQSVFSDERVAEGLLWMSKWAFGREDTETSVLELGMQREVGS